MEKVKLAPTNQIHVDDTLQEIKREELDEAGVTFDYLDEVEDKNSVIQNKRRRFKNHKRWILLFILIMFVTVIMKLGWSQMSNEYVIDCNQSNWNTNEKILNDE